MVIYKTTNLINGKFYVGKDKKNNPKYLGSGELILKAIKKYGKLNFKKEILEVCNDVKELAEKERFWIEKLDARNKKIAYNIGEGGDGGDNFSGHPKLKTIKKKISDTSIGRTPWNKGKTKIYSDETIKKMSDTRTKMVGDKASNYVKILKKDLIKILLENSIKNTAKHFGVSISCIRGKIKLYNIDYKKIENKRTVKVKKTPNYYEISDELFHNILNERNTHKKTFEELSDIFKIGVNKLRQEFKKRNINIKRIRQ